MCSDQVLPSDVQKILDLQGISSLYPPQEEALPIALKGENVVVSIPTAAGKSLIAYLTIVHRLREVGGKALYIVPLRALAREKFEDLRLLSSFGLKVGITTGELDESNPHLGRYNVIVCTSEKADSLIRHGISWLKKISILVVDEIHLIHDASRGPTLEVIIARFKAMNPSTQVIALSATIKNAVELADWLDGRLVQSEWRPVRLREGVFYRDHIKFDDCSKKSVSKLGNQPLPVLVEESLADNGQILVFVNNRRSTVSLAQQLGFVVFQYLNDDEKKLLKEIIGQIKRDHAEITSVGRKLLSCVEQGVAFHNAGLSSNQRRSVEQGFKQRVIKCIVATPTLAAGVNIPARRVIIRDLWRYDANFGMTPIPILEYKQQAGRAGRPQYDTEGEAITLAKSRQKQDEIFYNYILADTEPIHSKLGNQAALRIHTLAAVATDFATNKDELHRFFDSTFYAYQVDSSLLHQEVDNALEFLLKHEFIKEENKVLFSTLFGSRTSSLYIDPLSALHIKQALEQPPPDNLTALSFLHIICSTPDIISLYLRGSDTWVEEHVEHKRKTFLIHPPNPSDNEYEWFLSDMKTAFLLNDWIEETTEDAMVSKFNIGPGDIHNLVETAQWLLRATREFARSYNYTYLPMLNDLILRVINGCKPELLNLISLRGIGRVRARALYKEGFHTVNDLRTVPIERLAEIKTIGKTIAASIKKQLGETEMKTNKDLDEFYPR